MKKFLLLLFLVFYFTQPTYSQIGTIWTKVLGTDQKDVGNYVQHTSDGGFIIIGDVGGYPADILLMKTDSLGNEQWHKTFGESHDDAGYKVRETIDGGFILIGKYIPENDSDATAAYVVKTNSSGDSLWTKKFYYSSYYYGGYGYDVIELEDSSYTVVVANYEDVMDESSVILVNINYSGEIVWKNSFQFIEIVDFSLIQNESEEYLVLCNSRDGSGFILIKADSLGNMIWYKLLDSSSPHSRYVANAIIENSDGNYILVGEGDNYTYQYVWATELDQDGDSLWYKYYDLDTVTVSSVFEQNDGGYLLGCTIDSSAYGVKIDESGGLVWKAKMSDGRELYSMCAVKDNKYAFITENLTMDISTMNLYDIRLTKVALQSVVIIEGDSLWIDDDWDGYATGTLDGSSSYDTDDLEITGYKWIVDDTIVGTTSQVEIELPAGVNTVTLEVTNENGVTASQEFKVDVYSYKMETNGAITASVSTIGDSLFFVSSQDDRIYCFSDEDQEEWFLSTGGDIQSTTTIGPNNNIYVGSDDTRLYSFDVNGNFLWDKPMGGVVSSSPSITPGGILYVGTSGERLYSINSADGGINWNYLTGGNISSSPSVSENGYIFFGSDDGVFYSLRSGGTLNWSYETDGAIKSSPAFDDSCNVYFGSNDYYLYALSSSGNLKWKFATGDSVVSSPVIDSEGNIYFGSRDGKFYCVSSGGEEQWSYDAGSAVTGSPTISQYSSVESEWRVYFGCDDGKFIALSLEGELEWYFETDGAIYASPLITEAGKIYVGSKDGSVYGFAENASNFLTKSGSSNDLHTPQWATFQKDYKRTGYADGVIASVEDIETEELPSEYSLMQNYPNPFNPTTTIQFELPEKSNVVLDVFNILGEKVVTLINEEMSAGAKKIVFNASNLSSGVYFYRLKAGKFIDVKKLTLLR